MPKSEGYYDRYQAGERGDVRRELIARGAEVREEPLCSEAVRVAAEVVRRARANLRTLHARLLDLGYEFADPAAALVDAGPDAGEQIRRVEQELGTLPVVARVWYETIASVDFRQADAQRYCRTSVRPPPAPDIYGLGSHPVLLFQSLDRCRELLREMIAEREQHLREVREAGMEELPGSLDPGAFLPLGGWASNCEPKGFQLPAAGIDGILYNDGGGDMYFVDELRNAFRWGGFPFWRRSLTKANYYSPFEYKPNFKRLLPLLKDGLLEL